MAAGTPASAQKRKLAFDERVAIMRGLTAEFATAKVPLPRSKKPLQVTAEGAWEKKAWDAAGMEFGPAARAGDQVQISRVEIEDDKLILELNGGFRGGRKWYDRIEVGMGSGSRTTPINRGNTSAPGGTAIALLFPKGVPALEAAAFKKMLAPVLDFEKRSATEQYMDALPPEIQSAIKEKRAAEGLDRDQVLLALGRPRNKVRETQDGVETEEWIYGLPPGKITFVTFTGSKVTRVKDTYAGLGGAITEPLPPR
ncbi:MAG: hypothetical protein HY822_00835 [Acidobacteria bacterium]|nr:hypothetical protein [Acidobacteriota bacterium]